MSQQSWDDFRLEAFGEPYMVWHDGPDFSAFQQRVRDDITTVERVLLEGLASDDPLAAQAVAQSQLGDDVNQRLLPVLTAALERTNGTFRVSVAQALIHITHDESFAAAIADVLAGTGFWSNRIDAAMALSHVTPTLELVAALMRGAHDPDYLVRYHSANSLLRYAGDSRDISELADEFDQLTAENAPDQWALVAAGLAGAASARVVAGR